VLKKRIIFTLLYKDGNFMLSRNFRLQKVGDIKWLLKNYDFSNIIFSIDELIILDVSRGGRNSNKFIEHVKILAKECFIPIAIGGGVVTLKQAEDLFLSGADKVVLNTVLSIDPIVVEEIAKQFGSQSIVASVDVKMSEGAYRIYIKNGTVQLRMTALAWLQELASMPIGEIYLNSIDRDGTGQGYLYDLIGILPPASNIPVIFAGGVGNYHHLLDGMREQKLDAVATAHLFNFVGNGLSDARDNLIKEGVVLPKWDRNIMIELKKNIFYWGQV